VSAISLGSFNDRLFSGKTFEKNILSMILDDLQEWFLGLWNGDDYKSENKLIHDAAPHILESILAMSCDELGNFTCKFSVNGSEYTLAKLPEAITFTLSTELPPGNVKSLNFESLDQLRARCLKLYFEHCQKSDMAIDLRTLNLSFNDLCGINFENRKLSLDDINYIISLNKTIVEGKTTRFFSVSKSFEPSDSSHDEINLVGAIVVDKDGNQISDKTPLDESLGGDASTCFPDGIIRNNLGLNRYVDSVAFIAALHAAKTSNYILDFTTLKQVKDGPPKDARAEKKADNSEFAAFTIGRLVASLNYKGCVLNERSLNIIQKWGGNALNIEGAFLGEHELTYETIHERFPKMLVNDRPDLCSPEKK